MFKWLSELSQKEQKAFIKLIERGIRSGDITSPEVSEIIRTSSGHVRTRGRIDSENRLICPKNGTQIAIIKTQDQVSATV